MSSPSITPCEHMYVDRHDDPEARIRDLERPLSDAAAKSELGASKRGGDAEYPPNAPSVTYGAFLPKAPSNAGFRGWRSVSVVVAVGVVAITAGVAVMVAKHSSGGATTGFPSNRPGSTTSKPNDGSPNNNVEIHASYDTYGEVAIPGTKTLHLPQGQLAISFDAAESSQDCDAQDFCGWGLPMPDLTLTITPPAGVAEPTVNEKAGPLSNIYGDVHQQVWTAQILQTGDYMIAIDANVTGFVRPGLAFGSTA
jgi:hypothetical protein